MNIDDAVALAEVTFAKWKNRAGHYPNLYNSHLKGKLGEVAIKSLLTQRDITFKSRFRNPKEQSLCDIEMVKGLSNLRLEIKTWSREHWADQGRCVKVEQLPKLHKSVDAMVWCVVDLPSISNASDLDQIRALDVTVEGWSTVGDVECTSPRLTGWRQINNYQLEEDSLRQISSLFD